MYKIIVYPLFFIILIVSCSSPREKNNDNSIHKDLDTIAVEIFNNKEKDLGKTELILIDIVIDNLEFSVNAIGVDSQTIINKYLGLSPVPIEYEDLKLHDIPHKLYMSQDALEYLSDFIKNNCDTYVYEKYYTDEKYFAHFISIIGEKAEFKCVCGGFKKKLEYYLAMKSWIYRYPHIEEFQGFMDFVENEISYNYLMYRKSILKSIDIH